MGKKKAPETIRTYNIPLRRQFLKVAKWRRTEKAVTAVREFLLRHMKSTDIKISRQLNEKLWQHGIKNPPHHIKVQAQKDDKGSVHAKLFGEKDMSSSRAKTPSTPSPAQQSPAAKQAPSTPSIPTDKPQGTSSLSTASPKNQLTPSSKDPVQESKVGGTLSKATGGSSN